LLASCYRKSLDLAVQHRLRNLAFPAISTGAYGFPPERATRIAVHEVKTHLEKTPSLEKVVFVCFDRRIYDCYAKALTE
jgi:O-acetyl-ADP-ribose deacetylase (regulator of RNase III)